LDLASLTTLWTSSEDLELDQTAVEQSSTHDQHKIFIRHLCLDFQTGKLPETLRHLGKKLNPYFVCEPVSTEDQLDKQRTFFSRERGQGFPADGTIEFALKRNFAIAIRGSDTLFPNHKSSSHDVPDTLVLGMQSHAKGPHSPRSRQQIDEANQVA